MRKYEILANKLAAETGCKTKIIPYVITWDGIVTKFHQQHIKEIGLTKHIEAYIQSQVLKKPIRKYNDG
ncbi:hypothetical protein ENBRE01_3442 [Enteropsectra breve]|nr:hypothetical protein ENBRE01_3442 [Enteropsectra breve]